MYLVPKWSAVTAANVPEAPPKAREISATHTRKRTPCAKIMASTPTAVMSIIRNRAFVRPIRSDNHVIRRRPDALNRPVIMTPETA